MKAEAETVIDHAAFCGIAVSEWEAEAFLQAKGILESDRDNAPAKKVMENFSAWMITGEKPWSFADFALHKDEA